LNCDPIARWYRWFEYGAFGGALMRRRVAFLPDVADARRVFVVGDGDGRFLVRLVQQNRGASIDYLDLSARMLELARDRVANVSVNFQQGDVLTAPLPQTRFDLIVTNFLLDCFDHEDVRRVVQRLASVSKVGTRWLVAEFRERPSGLRKVWTRVWLAVLYTFFRWTTGLKVRRLVDHRPFLEACGFRLLRTESDWFGLLVSELWERYD
jgi:ubiquinone/menaquinone biosynthesis C-methylase UbiE